MSTSYASFCTRKVDNVSVNVVVTRKILGFVIDKNGLFEFDYLLSDNG